MPDEDGIFESFQKISVRPGIISRDHKVSLDSITKSAHCKFNCITVNFEKIQHRIYMNPDSFHLQILLCYKTGSAVPLSNPTNK